MMLPIGLARAAAPRTGQGALTAVYLMSCWRRHLRAQMHPFVADGGRGSCDACPSGLDGRSLPVLRHHDAPPAAGGAWLGNL